MNFSRVRSKQLIALDKPAEFLDRLAQAGYHESMTGELSLKVHRIPHRLMGAALLRECRGSSPPMVMARLWALSQWVERAPVEAVLGGSCLEQLMSHGLVQQRGELVAASVDLCPVQGMWLAGGKDWLEWYPAIQEELLQFQQPNGSWEDQFSPEYGTAMACIILQMPNCYLPIFQR